MGEAFQLRLNPAILNSDHISTIDSDHADLVYEDHRSASFFKECDWYADISTEPGSDRTCTVSDIIYHVTGVYADQ